MICMGEWQWFVWECRSAMLNGCAAQEFKKSKPKEGDQGADGTGGGGGEGTTTPYNFTAILLQKSSPGCHASHTRACCQRAAMWHVAAT